MPIRIDGEAEIKGLRSVAELMTVAVRTAPKTRGVDEIVVAILTGDEKDSIAVEMERLWRGKRNPLGFFERDAGNVRRSPFLLLIGVRGTMWGGRARSIDQYLFPLAGECTLSLG